jgi:hypothetical protein
LRHFSLPRRSQSLKPTNSQSRVSWRAPMQVQSRCLTSCITSPSGTGRSFVRQSSGLHGLPLQLPSLRCSASFVAPNWLATLLWSSASTDNSSRLGPGIFKIGCEGAVVLTGGARVNLIRDLGQPETAEVDRFAIEPDPSGEAAAMAADTPEPARLAAVDLIVTIGNSRCSSCEKRLFPKECCRLGQSPLRGST